jgi:NTE family protein
MPDDRSITLVCGGGGVWGVAWMTGLAKGFADLGLSIASASAFVGTSAGSIVSTQLTSGVSIDELFERQTNPARQPGERAPSAANLEAMTELLRAPWRDDEERLRAMCNLADAAETISAEQRRLDIIERIGIDNAVWPSQPLSIAAIDMETLELQVFDARSGVSLVDAVAASCAVPGVWPPARILGRRYIDGGLWRSTENAQLAAGAQAVLILSPLGRLSASILGGNYRLEEDVRLLEEQGAKVVVIAADDSSLRTMAPGPLDPVTRGPGAEAGRLQASHELDAALSIFD